MLLIFKFIYFYLLIKSVLKLRLPPTYHYQPPQVEVFKFIAYSVGKESNGPSGSSLLILTIALISNATILSSFDKVIMPLWAGGVLSSQKKNIS